MPAVTLHLDKEDIKRKKRLNATHQGVYQKGLESLELEKKTDKKD